MATLLDARDWDYVVGSVHFLRDEAVDMRGSEWDVWRSGDPEKVWARYFETLGEAARTGHVRHPRPPRPGEGLGRRRARARRRPAPLLRAGDGRDRRVRRGDRGLHRRAAQAGRRDLPGRAVPGDVPRGRAARWRCPATPTCPSTSATSYDRAVEWLGELGRHASWPSSSAASGGWSRSDERARRHRLRLAPPRGRAGRWSSAGCEVPERRARPDAATPTPTCSPTRSSTPCWAPPGLGDIGQHFPDTDERWRDADSIALLREVCALPRRARLDRRATSTPP